MRAPWASLPLVLALAVTGCGGAPASERVAAGSEAIAGGELDETHEAVFALYTNFGGAVGGCTASLIAPNLLLTARHCVSPSDGEDRVICGSATFDDAVAGDQVITTNDAVPNRQSPIFRGASVRVPSEGEDTCGFDIALITLSEAIPNDVAEPAIPRIDREVEAGETYSAVGYGVDENGEQTEGRMLLEDLSVACSPGACGSRGIESTEFLGETGVCSGDSGGPALDQAGKVIGVVSRGSEPCETPIYGTVFAWRDLIVETALEAAALGGYDPPFWAVTLSSDPPVVEPEPEPEPEPIAEGEACGAGDVCEEGSVCYFRGEREGAICSRVCEDDAACGEGQSCYPNDDVPEGGVCWAADEETPVFEDSGSCSFRAGPARSGATLLWILGACLTLAGARRLRVTTRGS
jgi:V8-like Glu-specific endopeptidase